jgi:hypothetical protein
LQRTLRSRAGGQARPRDLPQKINFAKRLIGVVPCWKKSPCPGRASQKMPKPRGCWCGRPKWDPTDHGQARSEVIGVDVTGPARHSSVAGVNPADRCVRELHRLLAGVEGGQWIVSLPKRGVHCIAQAKGHRQTHNLDPSRPKLVYSAKIRSISWPHRNQRRFCSGRGPDRKLRQIL